MRMNACGRVELRVAICHADAGFQIRRAVARADRDHLGHACCERALDHRFAIGIELFAIEMAVRVDEHCLLQAGPDGRVFKEADQRGIAAFHRRRNDHALRL